MSASGPAAAEAGVAAADPQHYVGLVRGINVGGNNRITMADFRAVFEGLGYMEVATLLQSGNVVFAAARPLVLADVAAIEAAFAAAAGFRAGFVVLSAAHFLSVLDANPLLAVGTDLSRLVVTFLPQAPDPAPVPPAPTAAAAAPSAAAPTGPPAQDAAQPVAAATPALPATAAAAPVAVSPPVVGTAIELPDPASILPEVFAAGPHAVYSWHPDGISNSRVPATFWKRLGPVYTARNVNTANKLAALLRARAT
ncbi:DUF1697 domain-containing protein [Subtercola boreus]|uniref:DUF1697 domain-containing protein n=1 Tax=Subtercola boreus TaxID=120213 RepID=UPI0015585B5A|nr:DUF1697 domain-containing protein [Subtercola boreus]